MSHLVVYGLRDPRNGEIRYVGKSTSGLFRPSRHGERSRLDRETTYKTNWIKSLQQQGLDYEVVLLESVDTEDQLNQAECKWIAIGRSALGSRLTNTTDGGEGGKLSGERLERFRVLMKSDEYRAKMRSVMGSPEMRARISAAKKHTNIRPRMTINLRPTKVVKRGSPHACATCKTYKVSSEYYRTQQTHCKACMRVYARNKYRTKSSINYLS